MWLIAFLLDFKVNLTNRWERFAPIVLTFAQLGLWYNWLFVGDFPQRYPSHFFLYRPVFYVVVFLNVRIKPVLYFVLWSSWKLFTNFRPFASNLCIQLDDFSVLFVRPIFALDFRVKLVNETLSDLFSGLGADHFGKEFPIFSNFFDHLSNGLILFRRPYFSIDSELGKPSITMKTLVFVTISHKCGDTGPLFRVFLIQFDKLVVLLSAPCFDFSLFAIGVFMLDLELEFFAILPGYWDNKLSFHFFYFFIFIIEVGYKHDKYELNNLLKILLKKYHSEIPVCIFMSFRNSSILVICWQ